MSWTRSGGGRKRRPRPSGTVHRIPAVLRVPCTTRLPSIPPRTLRSIICRSRRSAAFRVRCARQSFVRPSGSAAQAPREAGILGLETQRGSLWSTLCSAGPSSAKRSRFRSSNASRRLKTRTRSLAACICHIRAGTGLAPACICTGTGLTPCHICSGSGLISAKSAPGLGLTLLTSAPGQASPLPPLH